MVVREGVVVEAAAKIPPRVEIAEAVGSIAEAVEEVGEVAEAKQIWVYPQ